MTYADSFTPSIWTDELVTRLRQLWADGDSCSQIAAQLSICGTYISRNAVIGKVSRLSLPPRAVAKPRLTREERIQRERARQRMKLARRLAKGRKPTAPVPPPEPITTTVESRPCSLLELTADNCRFPIGDPTAPDFHFCGAPPLKSLPYCAFHHRVTHTRGPLDKDVEKRPALRFANTVWGAA